MKRCIRLALSLPLMVLLAKAAAAEPFDANLYARLLERHTRVVEDAARVRVDYSGLANSPDWRRLLENLAKTEPDGLTSQAEKLAFWINAYNILAMRLVADNYPVAGIREIGNLLWPVWKREAGVVGGKTVTLAWIEHDVLRLLGEPRIHVAMVCASVSCPALRREPWRAERLEHQFDDSLRRWLADPEKGLRVDVPARTLLLSRVFKWFEEDFEAAGGVLTFIAPYLSGENRAWLEQNPRPRIRYLDYDWSLNGLVTRAQGEGNPRRT
jgi:hypothetical protein